MVERAPGRLSALASTIRRCAAASAAEPEVLGLGGLVRPGDVCFDIGAAYGMYSFPLADLVGPHGLVCAFEPQAASRRVLAACRRLCAADNVRISAAAASSASGTLDMVLPVRWGVPIRGHAHPRAGAPQRAGRVSTRTWTVPAVSVDEFRERNQVGTVRFMKVDVEGFEPAVIRGARRTIEDDHPLLLLEIEARHLSRYGTTGEEFSSSLRHFGYAMHTWQHGAWTPTTAVTPEQRNYLFAAE